MPDELRMQLTPPRWTLTAKNWEASAFNVAWISQWIQYLLLWQRLLQRLLKANDRRRSNSGPPGWQIFSRRCRGFMFKKLNSTTRPQDESLFFALLKRSASQVLEISARTHWWPFKLDACPQWMPYVGWRSHFCVRWSTLFFLFQFLKESRIYVLIQTQE